jgi:hypothetical protein
MSEMIMGKIDLGKAGAIPCMPPPPPPPPPRTSARVCIDLELRWGETVIESKIENGYVVVVTSIGRIFKVVV